MQPGLKVLSKNLPEVLNDIFIKWTKMKKFISILVCIELLFSACSKKEISPEITLNDSTFIKIVANDIIDTLTVYTRFCSYFPFRPCQSNSVRITKPGLYYITYRMTKPEFVKFEIGDSFQSMLIPGDTMIITVGHKNTSDKKPLVFYKTSGNIYDYYQVKKEKLGYYSFLDYYDTPVKEYFKRTTISKESYEEAINILNTSVKQNNLFLDENKKSLPHWFIDLEKANIVYGSAAEALELYNLLKPDDQKDVPFYVVDFNNQDAHLSALYYYYLFRYLDFKYPRKDFSLPVVAWETDQFKKGSQLVDSILSGEMKEYFTTCRLADLYFFSDTRKDIKYVDAFISDNYPGITEDQIKFIKYTKNQIIRALKIKDYLPKGDKAPSFYLKDINGTAYQLSKFSGKIIYLHFWATWCEPCIKEIPSLNKLYATLNRNKSELINICLDDNPEKWHQIIEKEKLKGVNLICKGNWEESLKEEYFITELPHYTLIDKNGSVITNKCSGPEEIYPELELYLDEK